MQRVLTALVALVLSTQVSWAAFIYAASPGHGYVGWPTESGAGASFVTCDAKELPLPDDAVLVFRSSEKCVVPNSPSTSPGAAPENPFFPLINTPACPVAPGVGGPNHTVRQPWVDMLQQGVDVQPQLNWSTIGRSFGATPDWLDGGSTTTATDNYQLNGFVVIDPSAVVAGTAEAADANGCTPMIVPPDGCTNCAQWLRDQLKQIKGHDPLEQQGKEYVEELSGKLLKQYPTMKTNEAYNFSDFFLRYEQARE